ncbi:MAG: hypothetical protein EOM52_03705 [Clostridia bacterium]|nr:hypothetical protein [Clostridia bacterium]
MLKAQRKLLALALVLLVILTLPGRAMPNPVFDPIAGLDSLLAWYSGKGVECELTADLIIDRPVVLDREAFAGINIPGYSIYITAQGSLTLDSQNLAIAPDCSSVITVESGGELHLLSGGIYGACDSTVILLRPGAIFEQTGDFYLDGLVQRELSGDNGTLPPDPTPTPTPTPGPETAPITDLQGEIRKVANGAIMVYLILPCLPMEVTIVTLERSTDREDWTSVCSYAWDAEMNYPNCVNSGGCNMKLGENHVYISHQDEAQSQPFYLRVDVSGPDYAGISNEVLIKLPDGVSPGDNTKPPAENDYEDSGGTRGGAGQGKFERVEKLPSSPEPTPSPPPAAPSPTPDPVPAEPPEETPAPLPQPTPDTAPIQQSTSGRVSLKYEPPAVPAATPTPTPVVSQTPQPAESPEVPIAAPTPGAAEALPAASAAPGESIPGAADRNWVAAGATAALVTAALVFLNWSGSKRKS